ncbi:MAG: hypothetical protein HGA45_07810 [Chloroflexales bacterium]|nr:hypothetical protein [Chloroflexales bacterium]
MDLTAFHNQFREETAENIRILGDGLIALEGAGDEGAQKAHIDRIFRAMHTVKGSARMLGFESVGRLAHALENLLGDLRQGRRAMDRDLADALLAAGDAILALTAALVEGRQATVDVDAIIAGLPAGARGDVAPAADMPAAPAAPVDAPPPQPALVPARGAARQTVRVRVDRLDRMLNLAGELVMGQQALANHVEQIAALQQLVAHQGRALTALEDELGRLRFSPVQRQSLDQRLRDLRSGPRDPPRARPGPLAEGRRAAAEGRPRGGGGPPPPGHRREPHLPACVGEPRPGPQRAGRGIVALRPDRDRPGAQR